MLPGSRRYVQALRRGALLSELQPAYRDVFNHHPVRAKTVDRVSRCGGNVLFEKCVTNPAETVTEHRKDQQSEPPLRDQNITQCRGDEDGSNEMQAAARSVAVLR